MLAALTIAWLSAARHSDPELVEFFKKLGYEVSWDGKMRTGERWHEVFDGGRLVIQVDFGVPLTALLEDLPLLVEHKEGTSSHNYTINGTNSDLGELLRRATALKNGEPVEGCPSRGMSSPLLSK